MKPLLALFLSLLCRLSLAQNSDAFTTHPAGDVLAAKRARAPYAWTDAALRDAIGKAISFPAPSQTIARVSEECLATPAGEPRLALLTSLGTNNLSFVLLAVPGPDLAPYELELDPASFALMAVQRTSMGLAPVLLEDVVEHEMLARGAEIVTGHFLLEVPTAMRARCVYSARHQGDSWVVERMVLARKGSLQLDDGFDVFKAKPMGRDPSP